FFFFFFFFQAEDGIRDGHVTGVQTCALPILMSLAVLTRVNTASDIITRDKFRNFELTLEWNIAPAGNSGIFYRGSEDDDAIYWNAPEMQVLDDAGHVDGKSRLTSAGAAYDVDPSPAVV